MKRYFGGLWAGESDTKSRIKGILNYKKPVFWVIAVITVGLAVMGVLLLSNQSKPDTAPLTSQVESIKDESKGSSAKTDLTTVNKAQTIAVPQDADVPNVTVYEKEKIEQVYYTSAVIQATIGKQGPGNNYNDLVKLPYGRLVYINGIYKNNREWYLASLVPEYGSMEGPEPLRQFWVNSNVTAPGTQVSISFDEKFPLSEVVKYKYVVIGDTSQEYDAFTRQTPDDNSPLVQPMGDGNLISVVRKDQEWSLVMKFNGSAMHGLTDLGWIRNDSYCEYKPNMKVTQGFVLRTAKMYENPDVNSRQYPTQNLKSAIIPVNILKSQNGWTYISSGFNGLALWVKSNEVRYSFTADELFKIDNPTIKN